MVKKMSFSDRNFSILLLFIIVLQTCLSIQLYEVFRNLKLIPDLLPNPPTKLCNVTYVSKTGTLVLRPGQRIPPEYRKIHPNVTWPVRWNKTYCLYMTGISRWQVKLDRRKVALQPNTTNYPFGTTFYPFGYEWHNWLVVNIPMNDVGAGQTLYGHLPILNPPEPDVVDRYAFFVFEQVFGLINFTAPIDGVAYKFQELSRTIDFVDKYMLGNPIFGNCFINKWVPYTTTSKLPYLADDMPA